MTAKCERCHKRPKFRGGMCAECHIELTEGVARFLEEQGVAEATATGPERDLADLERLARTWGIAAVWADPDAGHLVSVSWGDPSFDEPDTPKELHYYIRGDYGTCAEALALLREKGAKDGAG